MIKNIINWTLGGFFRALGRFLLFAGIGVLLFLFVSKNPPKWSHLLGIETIYAEEQWLNQEYSSSLVNINWSYNNSNITCNNHTGAVNFNGSSPLLPNVSNGVFFIPCSYNFSYKFTADNYMEGGKWYDIIISTVRPNNQSSDIFYPNLKKYVDNNFTTFPNFFNTGDFIVYDNNMLFGTTTSGEDNNPNAYLSDGETFRMMSMHFQVDEYFNGYKYFFHLNFYLTQDLKEFYFTVRPYYESNDSSGQSYWLNGVDMFNTDSFKYDYNSVPPTNEDEDNNIGGDILNGIGDLNNTLNGINDTLTNTDTTDSQNEFNSFLNSFELPYMGNLESIVTLPIVFIQSLVLNNYSDLCFTLKDTTACIPSGRIIWKRDVQESFFGKGDPINFILFFNLVVGGFISYSLLRSLFITIQKILDPVEDSVEVLKL